MRSVSWYKCGNANLKGKLTKRIMAGKYTEEVIVNHKPDMQRSIEIDEMLRDVDDIYKSQ